MTSVMPSATTTVNEQEEKVMDKDDDDDEDDNDDAMSVLLGISQEGMCLRHPHIRILIANHDDDDDEEEDQDHSLLSPSGAAQWHTCPICASENRARHLHPRAKSYANVVNQVKQLQATPEFHAFLQNWGTAESNDDDDEHDEVDEHDEHEDEDYVNIHEQDEEEEQDVDQEEQEEEEEDEIDQEGRLKKSREQHLETNSLEQHHQQEVDEDHFVPPPPPPPMEDYDDSDDKLQFHDASDDLTPPKSLLFSPPPPPPLKPSLEPAAQSHYQHDHQHDHQHQHDHHRGQQQRRQNQTPTTAAASKATPPSQPHPMPRNNNNNNNNNTTPVSAKARIMGSMRSIQTIKSARSLRKLDDPNVIWVDRSQLQKLLERMDQVHDWVLRQREDELEKLKRDNQVYQELLMEREDEIRQLKNVVAKHEKTIQHELKEIKRVAVQRQQRTAAAALTASGNSGHSSGEQRAVDGNGVSGHSRSGIVINHMKVEVNQASSSSLDGPGMHTKVSADISQEQLEQILQTTAHATMAAFGGSGGTLMTTPISSPKPVMTAAMTTSSKPTPKMKTSRVSTVTSTPPLISSTPKSKSLSPARTKQEKSPKSSPYPSPLTSGMSDAGMLFSSPQVTNRSSMSSYATTNSPAVTSATTTSLAPPSLAPPSLADYDCNVRPSPYMQSITSIMTSTTTTPPPRSINTKAGPAAASVEALWAESEQQKRVSKEVYWDGNTSGTKLNAKISPQQQQPDRKRSTSLSPSVVRPASRYGSHRSYDHFNESGEVIFIPTAQEAKDTQQALRASVGERWLRSDLAKQGSVLVTGVGAAAATKPSEGDALGANHNAAADTSSSRTHRSKPPPGASPMPTRKTQTPPTTQSQHVYPRQPSKPRLPQINETPSIGSNDVTESEEEKKQHGVKKKDDEDSITIDSNWEEPPPNKTVTVDRKLQAKLSGLTLTTMELNETLEASHGRIITKARRELPMEQELDFDDSDPSQTTSSAKPSTTSGEDDRSFPAKTQASNIALARQPSKDTQDQEDDEQSISVYSENDALHYRAKAIPHVDDDRYEGSRFSASDTSRAKEVAASAGDGFLYQVSGEVICDPYGDQGTYWGFISSTTSFPHGRGKMSYDNGRKYEGEWKHGRWHGQGRLVNPNGDTYEGEFDHDARHGHGCYKWANNNVYEGDFFEDKRQGKVNLFPASSGYFEYKS
jgi:hypothetical protein